MKIAAKMSLVLSTVLLSASLLGASAHAGLLLEPYLAYDIGSYTQGTTNQNQNGLAFGGRVGYESFLGWMVGVDFSSGNWTDNSTPSETITPSDLGVFVGFDFPILLRVWGEYGFLAQRKFAVNSNSDTYKGSDLKLGVGFKVLPLLSINVEYVMGTFTKDDGGSLTTNRTDKMVQIGVSLPFNLL